MLNTCPNCGYQLPQEIKDGIAFCSTCDRIVQSTLYERLLGSGHYARRNHVNSVQQLQFDQSLTEEEAILVNAFVIENQYSHQDFDVALKRLGLCDS